jgi:molybdopterin synthase catalytic subunit
MRVRVLFFGRLKDIVGRAEEDADLADGACLEDLFARYGARFPELAGFRSSVVASVNQTFADWQSRLASGDEVAFLPPVSGGAGTPSVAASRDVVRLVHDAIPVAAVVESLKAPEDGAVIAFEGMARNHSRGRRTLYLNYEAYEEMALRKLHEIAAAMHQQFKIDHVALIHRVGRIEIGETSVLVAVASAHRADAFAGCRFGIDTLKRVVPIWKREYFEDGVVWADGEVPPLPSNSGSSESIP